MVPHGHAGDVGRGVRTVPALAAAVASLATRPELTAAGCVTSFDSRAPSPTMSPILLILLRAEARDDVGASDAGGGQRGVAVRPWFRDVPPRELHGSGRARVAKRGGGLRGRVAGESGIRARGRQPADHARADAPGAADDEDELIALEVQARGGGGGVGGGVGGVWRREPPRSDRPARVGRLIPRSSAIAEG